MGLFLGNDLIIPTELVQKSGTKSIRVTNNKSTDVISGQRVVVDIENNRLIDYSTSAIIPYYLQYRFIGVTNEAIRVGESGMVTIMENTGILVPTDALDLDAKFTGTQPSYNSITHSYTINQTQGSENEYGITSGPWGSFDSTNYWQAKYTFKLSGIPSSEVSAFRISGLSPWDSDAYADNDSKDIFRIKIKAHPSESDKFMVSMDRGTETDVMGNVMITPDGITLNSNATYTVTINRTSQNVCQVIFSDGNTSSTVDNIAFDSTRNFSGMIIKGDSNRYITHILSYNHDSMTNCLYEASNGVHMYFFAAPYYN